MMIFIVASFRPDILGHFQARKSRQKVLHMLTSRVSWIRKILKNY